MITLGIDLGTTKVAAVLLDTGSGKLLAAASEPHHAALDVGIDGAEQDPQKLLDTAFRLIRSLPEELLARLDGIGVTGQMHSVLGWGRKRLFPLVTWQDRRCGAAGLLEDFSRRAGHPLRDGFGAATLARLAAAGALEEWEHAATIADFMVCRLTEGDHPLTDPADAASWGIFDLAARQWDFGAAKRLGIPERLLPEIRPSGSPAGVIPPSVASVLGIPAGTPVAVATGDNQASILSFDGDGERDLFLTLGTGAQLSAVISPEQAAAFAGRPELELRPYVGGKLLAVVAPLCGGRAFAWLGDVVKNWLSAFGAVVPSDGELLDRLDAMGAARLSMDVPPELRVSPRFLGERHAPGARGKISGISLGNFTLDELAAALALGIVRNLKQGFPPELLAARKRIIGSGNGVRRVKSIQMAIQREIPLELILPEAREEAACGAARLPLQGK